MSRIVVTSLMGIDGYASGRGGDLSVLPFDGTFSEYNAERVRAATGLLMGGTTYRQMLSYWPQPAAAESSAADREIFDAYAAGLPVTVVSDSITEAETGVWRDQTTIVGRADAAPAIQSLRDDGDDREVVVFGSHTLWTDLLARGLVDELHLQVGPKIVAGDARAFTGVPETELRLLGVRQVEGSEIVVLQYAVGR